VPHAAPANEAHEIIHDWMPFDVFYKADAPKGQRRRIRGIISTAHRDLQGERVDQDGMDLTAIREGRGWFNDNHERRTGYELGVPTRVWRTDVRDATGKTTPATGVEGYLLDTPDAQRVWSTAKALQGTGRSLGFSVEGAILERDPLDRSVINRSVVRQIAITRCPVNPHTRLDLAKAANLTEHMRKAVTVGAQFPGASGQPGQMGALVPQSLDGARRRRQNPDSIQIFGGVGFDWDEFNRSWSSSAALDAARPKLTKALAAAYVRLRRPGATDAQVRAVLRAAQRGTP